MKTFRVSKLPGTMQTVASANGMTLAEAITEAGFDSTGFVVSLNGYPTTNFNQVLADGADVVLTKASKGAC